jgi:hypothetical protein
VRTTRLRWTVVPSTLGGITVLENGSAILGERKRRLRWTDKQHVVPRTSLSTKGNLSMKTGREGQ